LARYARAVKECECLFAAYRYFFDSECGSEGRNVLAGGSLWITFSSSPRVKDSLQELERFRSGVRKRQAHIKAIVSASAQRCNPQDFSGECRGRGTRERDVEPQKAAYSVRFVAVNPQAPKADVDGLHALRKKLLAGRTAIEWRAYPLVPAAIYVVRHCSAGLDVT
jgi:hypothetical protein